MYKRAREPATEVKGNVCQREKRDGVLKVTDLQRQSISEAAVGGLQSLISHMIMSKGCVQIAANSAGQAAMIKGKRSD